MKIKNNVKEHADAQDRIAELERAVTEQCLLNGKGSEREYALLGKVARLEAEVERLTELLRIESAASAHALLWAEKAEDDTLRLRLAINP
jgi:hypothetical protein